MAPPEPKLLTWLSRAGSWRGNRRQTGVLAAALLAALGSPTPSSAGHKKHNSRSSRGPKSDRRGRKRFCGGIASIPCPKGFTCIDDPSDDCDPENGGADCGGICVRTPRGRFCGGIAGIPCPEGFVCVDDPDDDCDPANGGADCGGICVKKGDDPCSRIRCADGTTCCPRCGGLCILPSVACTGELCQRQPCGEVVCGPGEFCCDANCGACSPIGGGCTDHYCPPPAGEPCGDRVCPPGEVCCNAGCGGGGICAPKGARCPLFVCPPPAGERCGKSTCPRGTRCCNASCGICTPPGAACIMIACEDDPR